MTKNAIFKKQINGVLVELMAKTDTDNVVLNTGVTLSEHLATLFTEADAKVLINDAIAALIETSADVLETLEAIAVWKANNEELYDEMVRKLADIEADIAEIVDVTLVTMSNAISELAERCTGLETRMNSAEARATALEVNNATISTTLATKARVLADTNIPEDLTEQDLFLHIV